MIGVTVSGAAGRMGKELIRLISFDSEFNLSGAVETTGHSTIGLDSGRNAGIDNLNIPITDDLSQVASKSDVVIDFSTPKATLLNSQIAVGNDCGIVIGTTGFTDNEKNLIKDLTTKNGRIVLAPNMSIGVNLLFLLCRQAAKILDRGYDVEIIEMHHKHKKDSPSGTAEKLGEIIASAKGLTYSEGIRHGRFGMVGERPEREIGMHSVRGGDVVGDHHVIFAGDGERVELVHKASSRATFAKGALFASKFIVNANSGFYSMQDVLDFSQIAFGK